MRELTVTFEVTLHGCLMHVMELKFILELHAKKTVMLPLHLQELYTVIYSLSL